MKTKVTSLSEDFNEIDKAYLKDLFKENKRVSVIVDLKKNTAILHMNGKPIGEVEKHPKQWGFRLTAPLSVRFRKAIRKGITEYYCSLKSIYEVVEFKLQNCDTSQFEDFLNIRIKVNPGQLFTMTPENNAILFGPVKELDFDIPRHVWNKAVAFKREVDYSVRYYDRN